MTSSQSLQIITDANSYISHENIKSEFWCTYMQLSKVRKQIVIAVVTAFSLLSTSNAALADYITSQGSGGNYRYELWTDGNNNYYLKIWRIGSTSESPYTTTRYFSSSREALIYFDCNYTDNCPQS